MCPPLGRSMRILVSSFKFLLKIKLSNTKIKFTNSKIKMYNIRKTYSNRENYTIQRHIHIHNWYSSGHSDNQKWETYCCRRKRNEACFRRSKISLAGLICINCRKKEGKTGGGGEGRCDAYFSPAKTNQLTASLRFHFKENSLLSS